MKRTSTWALISIGIIVISFTALAEEQEAVNDSQIYQLDTDKTEAYKLKEAEENLIANEASIETNQNEITPQIITEKIDGGRIEKLLDEEGKIIAEKTIKGDKVVKKLLNYYYPNGNIMRQVTALENDSSFYAEEYYANGKLMSQATYINEANKIGKEKKYDANGTLRQEIPWKLPKSEKDKNAELQQTVRHGNVVTYYPDGKIAAAFPVGMTTGKTVFFDKRGFPIKEVEGGQLLRFMPELTPEDCKGASIQLTLETLVELYEDEGDISYNKCGFPYRENFMYEVVENKGNHSTMLSYDENGMLRKITPYVEGRKNGLEQKFDASGNLTAEINYKNGIKDGYANGYFPTREVAFRKRYIDGKVDGSLTCYFPNGNTAAEFEYENGLKEGKAIVNSPIQKELFFKQGKLINPDATDDKTRYLYSAIANLDKIDSKCLNVDQRLHELLSLIETKESEINKNFDLNLPEICDNVDKFQIENSRLVCYDEHKKRLGIAPISFIKGEYAIAKFFTPEGEPIADVSLFNKQKQGWSKKYSAKNKISAEVYFNQDKPFGSSRTYYPSGRVKEIISYSEDTTRKMIASYDEAGNLEFSLTYKDDEKQEAYINAGKDITVRFYKNKPDSIREGNINNPYNFIEYNFALGEYAVYQNNQLVKGGKLCNYLPSPDVKIVERVQNKPVEEPKEANEATNEAINKETSSDEIPFVDEEDLIFDDTIEPQTPKQEVKEETVTENKEQIQVSEVSPVAAAQKVSEPPILSPDEAPFLDDEDILSITPEQKVAKAEVKTVKPEIKSSIEKPVAAAENKEIEYNVENAIIPTLKAKHQAELAAQNIGPVTKPNIEQLTDVVQKESVDNNSFPKENIIETKTEKFYYPNGNLRKTIKTKGARTEEIKEYSKNGLLLTDTIYNKDKIVIEKYFGSGEVRRRTEKTYDDNAVNSFMQREDFYDTGKPRYEIRRTPETLLFSEKVYYPNGNIKQETTQTSVFSYLTKEYDENKTLIRETEEYGTNVLVKEYDAKNNIKRLTLNGKDIALSLASNSSALLKDNARKYNKKGVITAAFKQEKGVDKIQEYHSNGNIKSEVIYNNAGDILIKEYTTDGTVTKLAYLSVDGKLHIEKPELRVIPSYRERYWVDYNNPRWIENQDKYTIKYIARLNLDIVARMLNEINIEIPDLIKDLYEKY